MYVIPGQPVCVNNSARHFPVRFDLQGGFYDNLCNETLSCINGRGLCGDIHRLFSAKNDYITWTTNCNFYCTRYCLCAISWKSMTR
jgi:hypothetical protein